MKTSQENSPDNLTITEDISLWKVAYDEPLLYMLKN